ERLHRGLVAVEQRSIKVTRVPVDQDPAEVEDDGLNGRGAWREGSRPRVAQATLSATRSRTIIGITRSVFFGYSPNPGMSSTWARQSRSRSGPWASMRAWAGNSWLFTSIVTSGLARRL